MFLASKSQLPPFRRIHASTNDLYDQIEGSTSSSSSIFNVFNFDDFLSIFEFLSLASSAAISLYVAVSCGVQKGAGFGWAGSKIFVWQCVVLVASVVVGTVIRRRQWRRVCGAGFSKGANLLRRVEKLEEDLRSSATLIRVLSRQLEKLGIRVRATRQALKDPISETAALAQKNSEVTRALAAHEDILEKELGEIQNVLLAMQDQQQKQLELILAIGKARNLFNTQHVQTKDQTPPEASNSSVDADGEQNLEINQIETLGVAKASQ
ncbi:transmembrane protein [Perilla frutescens var. hirtella]|uniref:Transmembrane protein n=1 Tax=Perilla frutescens var. hirtella TaxID=608512 RepID=A0AAD4IVV1_PERFH|nr:transmembrane protein [Perilla frutescens var. hirtella]